MRSDTFKSSPLNIKATAWTVGVHVILFLLFILVKYSSPVEAAPATPELGMEVNLGTADDGLGDDQPEALDDPAEARATQPTRSAAQEEADTKELMHTDEADAPEVKPVVAHNQPAKNNNTHTVAQKTKHPAQQTTAVTRPQPQRALYEYKGSTGKGGNGGVTDYKGGAQGNTAGNGDRGVPNGTPGSDNYAGSPGPGKGGISHTLNGRSISPSVFQAEFHEGGKVVVRVTVDRDGNIINKMIISSSGPELSHIALQKLSQARFSKSSGNEPQQFGTVTILFKARS